MKNGLQTVTLFFLCVAAGCLLGERISTRRAGTTAAYAARETAGVLRTHEPAPSSAETSSATPAASVPPLQAAVEWERRLATVPLAAFPELLDQEIKTATDSARVFRLLTVWAERDLPGIVAWAKWHPSTISLPEAGLNIGVSYGIVDSATRVDPEKGWQIAGEIVTGEADVLRWQIVGNLVRQDAETAKHFIRKHADALASMGNANMGWYGLDPEKATPVAMVLAPGPNRLTAVKELARYYEDREGEIEAAGRWFRSLQPAEQEAVAGKISEKAHIYRVSAEHVNRLREVWQVPGSAGGDPGQK